MDPKDRSELIKNYMQIVAIVVAAIWTLYIFYQKEKPSLEVRVDASSDLRWERGEMSNTCKAVFTVDFENKGTRSFDIERVQIRAWRFGKIRRKSDSATFFEFNPFLAKENLISDESYTKNSKADVLTPLVGHYPPGVRYHHTFEWEVKQDPSQLVFFRADFYKKVDETQTPWYVSQWSPICAGLIDKKPGPFPPISDHKK